MPKRVEMTELYIERLKLLEMGGFTPGDLTDFLRRYDIVSNEDNLYPVTVIMKHMNYERKKRGGKDNQLDDQLKFERIQKERIINQTKLGELIPRSIIKERVRIAFQAVANKIRYSIKNCAPRMIGITNARDAENLLTQSYNNALDDLKKEAVDVSWDKDGIETELRRTELASDS